MKPSSVIKQELADALSACGIFDTVLTPPDDRRESTVMHEPAAAIFYTGTGIKTDNGIQIRTDSFDVYMKFLKIGVNETEDDIQAAIEAVAALEPESITQKRQSTANSRSGMYILTAVFAGSRG